MVCIAMKAILWMNGIFILGLLTLKGISCQSGAPVHVFVNQQATLFSNATSCEEAQFRRVLPTHTAIATCQKQQCSIKEGLREKYELKDNNLVLRSTTYKDWGTYECICNGTKTTVKWDVVVALDVTVDNQSNITLKCFAKDAKDVTWFYNDSEILHGNITGFTIIDKGFQKRLSLNEGWFEDGNLSLTMFNVTKKDAGHYFCRVNDGTTEGYPYGQMLLVNDANCSPGENKADYRIAFIISIIINIVSVATSVFLYVKQYKQPSKETELNHSENTTMLSSQHDESHSIHTIAQPVQESEIDCKLSSTKPFFDRSGQ